MLIIYLGKRGNGGYGDRLIGFASVATIARILGADFKWQMESDFLELCNSQTFVADSFCADSSVMLNLINQHTNYTLEKENLLELWKDKTVVIQANIPIHECLWRNSQLTSLIQVSADDEFRRSFQELFSKQISLSKNIIPAETFAAGIQIRCGDTYCMPHALAEQQIPENLFASFAKKLKQYLVQRQIFGKIQVTCDTYKIQPHFRALSDRKIEFCFLDRTQDIHFDFHNSNNRYREILADHGMLQQCKKVITGLRSNFGTTAAYCSPVCEEIVFYQSDWKPTCMIDFKSFDPRRTLVLKENLKALHHNTDLLDHQVL